jgi:hypothetical protein
MQDALAGAGQLRPDGMDGGQLESSAAVGGLDLGVPDPDRAAGAGPDQHRAVAVGDDPARTVRHDPTRANPGVLGVVWVRVIDVDRLAAKLGPYPEGSGVDAPQDLVGMVVPAERQPVLAQGRAVPSDGRATEAGQRRAAICRVDGHPGEDFARAVDRRRDDVPGVDLAHGGPGAHGELPPCANVAAVELLGRARRLSADHGQPPGWLTLQDRPGQRGRAAVTPDAWVRDPGGRALAHLRWHDLLEEWAEDHVGGCQPGEAGHVLGRHRGAELQILRPDDVVAVFAQRRPQRLRHAGESRVEQPDAKPHGSAPLLLPTHNCAGPPADTSTR